MSDTDAKVKTPGAIIAIIVIAVIVIILFIISLAILFTTAENQTGSKKDQLRTAGALIAISIPFAIVAFVLGARWISLKSRGVKSSATGWAFVIFAVLSSILLLIGAILGFTSDVVGTEKTNVDAASALAIIGFVGLVVIFFITVLFRRATLPAAEREKRTKQFIGEKRYEQYRIARGYSANP